MSNYAVAHIDEIDEQTDGRCPWRPIRAHFGVMSFGVTTWTARDADFDPIRGEPGFHAFVTGTGQ
jgi:hypothetical protein